MKTRKSSQPAEQHPAFAVPGFAGFTFGLIVSGTLITLITLSTFQITSPQKGQTFQIFSSLAALRSTLYALCSPLPAPRSPGSGFLLAKHSVNKAVKISLIVKYILYLGHNYVKHNLCLLLVTKTGEFLYTCGHEKIQGFTHW